MALAIVQTLLYLADVGVSEPITTFRRNLAVFQHLASVAAFMAAGFMFIVGKRTLGCVLCGAAIFFAVRSGTT